MGTWSLKEEFSRLAENWITLTVVIIAGGMLGWISSLVYPAPYSATIPINVLINAYRAEDDSYILSYTGLDLTNLDDYKNWQMLQLEFLATSIFSNSALEELQTTDSHWSEYDLDNFRENIHINWRNTGLWELEVIHPDAAYAEQAVLVWRDHIVTRVQEAVSRSGGLIPLGEALNEIASDRADLEVRLSLLEAALGNLIAEKGRFAELEQDYHLTPAESWELWATAALVADTTEAWQILLDGMPEQGNPAAQYLDWIDSAVATVRTEIDHVNEATLLLDANVEGEVSDYETESKLSLGLSANLYVEAPTNIEPEVSRLTQTGLFILLGSGISLLAYFGYHLIMTSREEKS